MSRQKGFVALYALLSLVLLLGLTVLALAHWNGMVQRERRAAGEAEAKRIANAFIQEKMFSDLTATSRPWLAPLAGEAPFQGVRLKWRRTPIDSRWRAGTGPWTPDVVDALARLGGRADRLNAWNGWMQSRQADLDRQSLGRIGLITDPGFFVSVFDDLGLAPRWGTPGRIWTMDPGGAAGRMNLLGSDAGVAAVLSGVPEQRIRDFQSMAGHGLEEASSAIGYWRFDEWQALSRWYVIHPPFEEWWEVEVKVPRFPEPILTRWRVSRDDGTPGNPWFRIQFRSLEQW